MSRVKKLEADKKKFYISIWLTPEEKEEIENYQRIFNFESFSATCRHLIFTRLKGCSITDVLDWPYSDKRTKQSRAWITKAEHDVFEQHCKRTHQNGSEAAKRLIFSNEPHIMW